MNPRQGIFWRVGRGWQLLYSRSKAPHGGAPRIRDGMQTSGSCVDLPNCRVESFGTARKRPRTFDPRYRTYFSTTTTTAATTTTADFAALEPARSKKADRLTSEEKTFKSRMEAALESVPLENIRNFSIIAHIDHGKSTLADRLLEISGNISLSDGSKAQYLDNLKVERERGITVKAQTASMLYRDPESGEEYLLNLVDTPGHVDFAYEVNRSLAACQGALLLVDSSQGIEAQTLATYREAASLKVAIVPVATKIDLPHAEPEEASLALCAAFDLDPDKVCFTSAKTGQGVASLFPAIVRDIPSPVPGEKGDDSPLASVGGDRNAPARCFVFDSIFDDYRGVVCLVKVVDGELQQGLALKSWQTGREYEIQEVGVVLPERHRVRRLLAGHVGYVLLGMRTTAEAKIGDTLCLAGSPAEPLPFLKEPHPMVFASIYPGDGAGTFDELRTATEKLRLSDPSVTVAVESSAALGLGLRCGFLGVLHMEVFHQRLADEHGMTVIATAPMVPYRLILPDGTERLVESASEFPPSSRKQHKNSPRVFEPMVKASILTPSNYLGVLLPLLQERRGEQLDLKYLDEEKVLLQYRLPWQEVVTDFFDQLKALTAGYATLDYEVDEPQEADIVRVDILLNGNAVDALSFTCHRSKAEAAGRRIALKLKNVVDRQQYEISIQAALGTNIIAKERIPPYRKDVLVKAGKVVGGGDVTRKKKLLEKQKKGKKRLKTVGNVKLSQAAFWTVMSR